MINKTRKRLKMSYREEVLKAGQATRSDIDKEIQRLLFKRSHLDKLLEVYSNAETDEEVLKVESETNIAAKKRMMKDLKEKKSYKVECNDPRLRAYNNIGLSNKQAFDELRHSYIVRAKSKTTNVLDLSPKHTHDELCNPEVILHQCTIHES